MTEFRVLRLGTVCHDKATQLEGTLTHWVMNMEKSIEYLFQPQGLNEEQQPLKKLMLCKERLSSLKDSDFEYVEVPFDVLGTIVTNKPSGFTGLAVQFIRHMNGCFHVEIQPAGTLAKTGTSIASNEFDLRECTGEKIQALSQEEHEVSITKTPSPSPRPERRSYDNAPVRSSRDRD